MSWKSTASRYGLVAIAIHWISAAAILALFGLGFAAANAADPATKAALLRVHVPLGAAIVVLTLLRIVWWRFDRRPDPLPGLPSWQERSERLVRSALYALILVMGVSGIGLMIASGAPGVLFFGEPGPLPDFWQFPPMYGHLTGAVLLLALAVLHIAAAIYHQLYRRDRLLARMWR
ncbi:MAG TPA: cytochrome b/b6 domain-containing protein [Hyphomicrobiales bacterium]|nr:cytochrome b/b6 domain-containing protein [Hyphomicrobiales bacterium]